MKNNLEMDVGVIGMDTGKKFEALANRYGFRVESSFADGAECFGLYAQNTDGEPVKWISYEPSRDLVCCHGNTDYFNIWLCDTRKDLSPEDCCAFVSELNAVFVLEGEQQIFLKEIIDPEDWQEIAGVHNAYEDVRYTNNAFDMAKVDAVKEYRALHPQGFVDVTAQKKQEAAFKLNALREYLEDKTNWRVEDCIFGANSEPGWELFQGSPAGEDFSIGVCHNGDIHKAMEEIRDAYEAFAVDDHIEMWLEARRNGVRGVPSARALVKDAEDIEKMLEELADGVDAWYAEFRSIPLEALLADAMEAAGGVNSGIKEVEHVQEKQ